MNAESKSAHEDHESQEPAELWHYTTLEGAVGILTSGEMWATDSRFLNDPEEYQHALTVTRELVIRDLEEDEFKREVVALLTRLEAFDSGNAPPLIASFSEASDELTQWRSYSSEGAGVALVLDLPSLKSAVSACDGVLKRCTYVQVVPTLKASDELRANIQHVLNDLRREWERYDSSNSEDVTDRNCGVRDTFRTGWEFEQLKLTLKPAGFSVEREWRAVFRGGSEGMQLRVSRGRIVPYRKIPLRTKGVRTKRIVLGPAAADGLSKLALEEYARAVGLDVVVTQSHHRLRT